MKLSFPLLFLYCFPHPYGCSQTGHDHAQTRKLLAALARHPNAGGVLILGLGCENLTHGQMLEELGDYNPSRVKFLTIQEVEDEQEAGRGLRLVLETANGRKTKSEEQGYREISIFKDGVTL